MAWTRRHTLGALLGSSAAAAPLAYAFSQAVQRPAPGDYMSAALRAQVDRLKADAAKAPTSDANYRDRALVLYDWNNALSLTGAYTHPDLPSTVSGATSPGFAKLGDRQRQNSFNGLDAFIRTLAALEANPRLCGTVTAGVDGPFTVDSMVTFQQTYTVGQAAIRPGGGLVLPNHFYFASSELQATDPKADNYVSLKLSNPAVKFAVDSFPIAGMFSARLGVGTAPRVYFRITEGELRQGDTMTVTYGDRSGGSRGLQLLFVSNSALRFPFWLLTEPDGIMLTPREATLPIVGGPAAGVRGFGPSIVRTGEAFSLSVRTEDRFRNLATGPVPGWRVFLNGKPYGEIRPGRQPITMLRNIRLPAGVHRFTFESLDGRLKGGANPVLAEDNPATRIYWGDTHGHCGFSEGMGRIDDYFRFARDEARLDFVTLSEHDIWLDTSEWEAMRRATKAFNRPGEFITFLGYEWTVTSPYGGHHNVLFRNVDGVMPVTCHRHPTLPDLYRGIRKDHRPADVMIIPHAHMTADATQNDRELEPLVEIVSEHGTFEWLGRRYLASGFQLGFIGAGDDHIGHPGYKPRPLGKFYFDGPGGIAAVYANSKQRDALFDAMKARRTYATNAERIILKCSLNGRPMGEVVPNAAERVIEGVTHGTGAIESITLLKNGRTHQTLQFDLADPKASSDDDLIEARFFSTSETAPLTPARSERAWTGRIIVEGATLAEVTSPQVEALNFLTEWARPSATDPNAVDFRVTTRGDHKAIRLKLKGDLAKARIRVVLSEGRAPLDATVTAPAAGAAPVVIPATEVDPGGERRGGGTFADEITVRRIRPAREPDRTFRFVDTDAPKDGDNYYVRIVQANGGTAWSSPAWVGSVKKAG